MLKSHLSIIKQYKHQHWIKIQVSTLRAPELGEEERRSLIVPRRNRGEWGVFFSPGGLLLIS